MQICHGRRRCSITADAGTFGRPCKNDIPMRLKVVYTCSKYYLLHAYTYIISIYIHTSVNRINYTYTRAKNEKEKEKLKQGKEICFKIHE